MVYITLNALKKSMLLDNLTSYGRHFKILQCCDKKKITNLSRMLRTLLFLVKKKIFTHLTFLLTEIIHQNYIPKIVIVIS